MKQTPSKRAIEDPSALPQVYLKELIPMILRSFSSDTTHERPVTGKLLQAFQRFGATLEEFLHMLLPHVVSLFYNQEVIVSVRR